MENKSPSVRLVKAVRDGLSKEEAQAIFIRAYLSDGRKGTREDLLEELAEIVATHLVNCKQ